MLLLSVQAPAGAALPALGSLEERKDANEHRARKTEYDAAIRLSSDAFALYPVQVRLTLYSSDCMQASCARFSQQLLLSKRRVQSGCLGVDLARVHDAVVVLMYHPYGHIGLQTRVR